ncbi:MAG: hypothetical protein HQM13_20105 [SAR324 cluster bacterium]|nr:hypothetical protein [SAR324 cluster bacterium]
MFLFMIKKIFFDWWDNFFIIFLFNLGYLVVLALIFSIPSPFSEYTFLSFLFLFLKCEVFFVYTGLIARMTKDISDYQTPDFSIIFQYFKQTCKNSFLFGGMIAYFLFTFSLLIPFYKQATSFWQVMLIWFYFWTVIGIFLIIQWFFPLEARLEAGFAKTLKKSLLFFLDNSFFSLGLSIGGVLILLISLGTGFLIPGIATVMLGFNVAVKLRLYKYDYLETSPNARRNAIPWEDLLLNDRETVGKRTIRGLLFPWKD